MFKILLNDAVSMKEELLSIRRSLHANAECGFNLFKTNEIIFSALKKQGLNPEKCGRGGIIVNIGENKYNAVLLRADTDALPITEETALPFSSRKNMHACGHDMHAAMLLGCAFILKKRECQLTRGVKLLFQPAEEILQGAKDCIESGVMENPTVKSAFMLHVLPNGALPQGSVTVTTDKVASPEAQFFKIKILGKSAHGAIKNEGVDALFPTLQIISGIKEGVCAQADGSSPVALSIGKINGGTAPNVVVEEITLEGTYRSYSKQKMKQIKEMLEKRTSSIANAYGCRATVEFQGYAPALRTDEASSEQYINRIKEELKNVYSSKELRNGEGMTIGGSEDFAYFSEIVPSVTAAITAKVDEADNKASLHHPKCVFNEEVLPLGAALYAINGFI